MYEVVHKCQGRFDEEQDVVVINVPEDNLVLLRCPKCREEFHIRPTSPDYFRNSQHYSIPGGPSSLVLPPGRRQ